jgi:hypothetical protein
MQTRNGLRSIWVTVLASGICQRAHTDTQTHTRAGTLAFYMHGGVVMSMRLRIFLCEKDGPTHLHFLGNESGASTVPPDNNATRTGTHTPGR